MLGRILLFILAAMLVLQSRAHDLTLQGATSGNFRFKDIGGQTYSQAFIDGYSYASAQVSVSFDTTGLNYLSGQINAAGLKPNFAYQIKLVGNPSKTALTPEQIAAADDAGNETLGRLGRWWRVAPNPANSNDAEYEINKNNPDYIYEGYLLIAFFTTDALGSANVRFEGNNSFHVLWRTDQRPRSGSDGPLTNVTVANTDGNSAYSAAVAARDYSLYGEHEPTRVQPGALQMPDGHYRCRFILNEESFHDSGLYAGQWTSAMSAPLEFDIPTSSPMPPPPPPPDSAMPLNVAGFRARLNFVRENSDRAVIIGTFQLTPGLALDNLNVHLTLPGIERNFVLNASGRAASPEGRMTVRPVPRGAGAAKFKVTLAHAKFSYSPDLPLAVRLQIGADDYAADVLLAAKMSERSGRLFYKK